LTRRGWTGLFGAGVWHRPAQPVGQVGHGVCRLGGDVGQQLRQRGDQGEGHRHHECYERMLGSEALWAEAFHGRAPWGMGPGGGVRLRTGAFISHRMRRSACQTKARHRLAAALPGSGARIFSA